MRKRLALAEIAGILTLALILLFAGPDKVFSVENVKIGSIGVHPYYYLTFPAAEENDFWKQNGLSVEWVRFESGRTIVDALAAGTTDMGWSSADTFMLAAARGVPLLAVADSGVGLQWQFWVLPDSPIKKPADLKGRKIGVTRLGAGSHSFGQAVSKGLRLEREMKFAATGGIAPLTAALKAGVVDAMVLPYLTVIKLKFNGQIRSVVDVEEYLPKPWMDISIWTSKRSVENKPGVGKATIRALLKATDFVMKNRRWSIEKLKSGFGYPEELAKEVHESIRFSKDGKISRAAMENMVNFLIEYGLVSKEKLPPIEDLYTTRFTD